MNVLGVSRILAGARGVIVPADFRLGESANVPENIKLANRNYMNLLELPVLFYVICIVAYSAGIANYTLLILAWLYVFLRLVHSVIHITYNNVVHRLYAFVASNTTLLALWVVGAVALAQKSVA